MKKIILFFIVSLCIFAACSSTDDFKINEDHASYQAMCQKCLASGGTWQGPNECTKDCDLMDTYCYVDSCPGECDSETCDCLTGESCINAGCDFYSEGEIAWCTQKIQSGDLAGKKLAPLSDKDNDVLADVNPGAASPWEMSSYIYTSTDGLTFEKKYFVADRVAVPHMIQAQNGDLVAVFQYFSEDNEDDFNVIAYSISEDMGVTWSEVEPIDFVGLPAMPEEGSVPKPSPSAAVDPTIAQLEDGRFRLYYTYHLDGDTYASPFSSIADTMDGEFVYEGKIFKNTYNTFVLDPAVVYFDGLWHYISSSNGVNAELEEGFMAIHAISEDGQEFEFQEDIYVDFSMLGGAVVDDEGLIFYGSGGPKGERAGYSADAYNWNVLEGVNYPCTDPGVIYLDDGYYMMICQTQN